MLSNLKILYAIELTVCCIVAYKAGIILATKVNLSTSHYLSGLWALISATVVLKEDFKDTIQGLNLRVFGSLLGSMIIAVLMTFLSDNIYTFFLAIFLTIIVLNLFSIGEYHKLAIITISVIYIVDILGNSGNHSSNYLLISANRFVESLLGSLIAVISKVVFISIDKIEERIKK